MAPAVLMFHITEMVAPVFSSIEIAVSLMVIGTTVEGSGLPVPILNNP